MMYNNNEYKKAREEKNLCTFVKKPIKISIRAYIVVFLNETLL